VALIREGADMSFESARPWLEEEAVAKGLRPLPIGFVKA